MTPQKEDILCKVENLPPDALNIHSIKVQGEIAYLTIIVPEPLLQDFQNFLQSTLSISRYIKKQAQVQKAIERVKSAEYQAELRKDSQKLRERVLARFDICRNSGLPDRKAIRETKEILAEGGFDLSCYTVELIVREAGRLSKKRKPLEVKP